MIPASKKGPYVLIGISAVALLLGLASISDGGWVMALIGAGLIALGIYWLGNLKDEYVIFLKSGSSETKALSSTDQAYIRKIVAALNDAIIHRG